MHTNTIQQKTIQLKQNKTKKTNKIKQNRANQNNKLQYKSKAKKIKQKNKQKTRQKMVFYLRGAKILIKLKMDFCIYCCQNCLSNKQCAQLLCQKNI